MSIQVQCPNPACGKVHKVKNRYAGKRCHCPSCHQVFNVPLASGNPASVERPTREPVERPASAPRATVPADDPLAALLDVEPNEPPASPAPPRAPSSRPAEMESIDLGEYPLEPEPEPKAAPPVKETIFAELGVDEEPNAKSPAEEPPAELDETVIAELGVAEDPEEPGSWTRKVEEVEIVEETVIAELNVADEPTVPPPVTPANGRRGKNPKPAALHDLTAEIAELDEVEELDELQPRRRTRKLEDEDDEDRGLREESVKQSDWTTLILAGTATLFVAVSLACFMYMPWASTQAGPYQQSGGNFRPENPVPIFGVALTPAIGLVLCTLLYSAWGWRFFALLAGVGNFLVQGFLYCLLLFAFLFVSGMQSGMKQEIERQQLGAAVGDKFFRIEPGFYAAFALGTLAMLLFLAVQYRMHKRKWVFVIPMLLLVGGIGFGVSKLDPYGQAAKAVSGGPK